MPSTSLFDRGASNNFFDPAIFDTAVHFTSDVSESVSVSDGMVLQGTYFRTINETVTVTDSIIKQEQKTISEPVISVIDSVSVINSLIRSLVETVTISDVVDRTANFFRQLNEIGHQLFDNAIFDPAIFDTVQYPISVSDSIDRSQSLVRILPESISITDDLSSVYNYSRIINETPIIVSDSVDRTANFFRDLNEGAISVLDSLAGTQMLIRTITEATISVSDSVSVTRTFSRILQEVVTVIDAVVGAFPVGHIHFHTIIKKSQAFGTRIKKSMSFTTRLG